MVMAAYSSAGAVCGDDVAADPGRHVCSSIKDGTSELHKIRPALLAAPNGKCAFVHGEQRREIGRSEEVEVGTKLRRMFAGVESGQLV
jgi:hypothetical protein